jgi:hypothetical protein
MIQRSWGDARPMRTASWTSEPFEEGLVLHQASSGRIVELDAAGATILALCDGMTSGSEIVAMLTAAFPEARAQITTDVDQTLERLLAAEVIALA